MNHELLQSFRDRINDSGLILKIYRNQSGRNKWSIICSAMDWIEVSLDGIDVTNLSRENDNQASIKMISYISCIDIMWEAVQQLHRVLYDTKEIPFKEDCSIFNQSVPDNTYFKTIRACFAAHTVNLHDIFPDDDKEEKWYASWSGGTFSKKDFSVILYSNFPSRKSRFFDVSFEEIYKFAEKRYQYLTSLMDRVDEIKKEYLESFRKIPFSVGNEILGVINILICENKKRFDNDYFDYELQKIKKVFETRYKETEKNNEAMNVYRSALKVELDEIKNRLQNMELEDLEHQVNDDIPSEIHYPFSKLSDAVWQNDFCPIFNYVVEKLDKYFSGIIDVDITMAQEEVYVLGCAAAYLINNQ